MQRFVMPPGAMNGEMMLGLVAAICSELLRDLFHRVAFIPLRDKNSVFRGNDDEIIHTGCCDHAVIGTDIAAMAVSKDNIAPHGVPRFVFGRRVVEGVPRTD